MRYVKAICCYALLAVFLLHTSVAYASMCNCPEKMQEQAETAQATKIPCHGMQEAKADNQDTEDTKSAGCKKCDCGHCKVPSQASLHQAISASGLSAKNILHIAYEDVFASSMLYRIETPPKPIS